MYAQVSTHDDEQPIPAWNVSGEELGILDRLIRVVDRARPDDDDDSVVLASKDARGREARLRNGLLRSRARPNLMSDERRLDEWVVLDSHTCY